MQNLYYRNESSKMVILRCVGPESFFREKVMLPYEDLVWDCPMDSRVDIWSYGLNGPELLDSIEAAQMLSADDAVQGDSPISPLMGTMHATPVGGGFLETI